jgi:hypothetical protein
MELLASSIGRGMLMNEHLPNSRNSRAQLQMSWSILYGHECVGIYWDMKACELTAIF